MHQRLAIILAEHKLINCSADSAVDNGITKAFFPHGLGHLIGLQTHDIGGHQLDRSGTVADTNDGHPFLRLRRNLEANTAITVEPGCYVIPELLKPFAGSSELNWDRIEWLRQFGGVRIEDTVVVTTDGPKNLTRPFV
jgi:Xaa-Pro dipeptidase